MLERYHRRRKSILLLLGNKCSVCESKKDLEIDHKNPESKSFNLAKAISGWNWEKVLKEVEKCQLLCSDCHKQKTRKDLSEKFGQREIWEHGTIAGYRHCRCDECRKAKRDYMREYRNKNK